MELKRQNIEWLDLFYKMFGKQSSFDSVANQLELHIIDNFNHTFFSQLQNIKVVHASTAGQYRDCFGDWMLSQKIQLDSNFDQVLTPYPIVDFMSKSTCEQLQRKFPNQPIQFIDPCCGTGRFMLSTHIACKTSGFKDYNMYCVDIDSRMIAYCITNALLHGINCHIILGDVLDFRIDTAWRVYDGKFNELEDFEHLYDVIGRKPIQSQKSLI